MNKERNIKIRSPGVIITGKGKRNERKMDWRSEGGRYSE